MVAIAVTVAALLAGGTTGLIANAVEQQESVSENALINYDGSSTGR
jgi:hypothetical protein